MPELDKSEITNWIRSEALKIGFDGIGFATAEHPLEEYKILKGWLSDGYQAEMAWLERDPEKRADPRILFPGAKSVLVVTQNYFTPHSHSESKKRGKVSRYAWGDDYHDVVKSKLYNLLARIKERIPESNGKVCVDTAPIMEKPWAVRAGLGWIGKHSNLITKNRGSWVFLGEIILDIKLDYQNKIEEDHCGSCTECIDACPTDAIVKPYMVDSTKCLSYATIELRTPVLPPDIADNLSGWLYGCDICQDVCPWNRFSTDTTENRFEPRKDNVSPSLERIKNLTRDEYVSQFRGSPMKRAKLSGLQRNARALYDVNEKCNKKVNGD